MWPLHEQAGSSGYERLSAGDWMFLACEREKTPMNVGATLLFDGWPHAGSLERLRDYVDARLADIPAFRRRLERTWGTGVPIWIDDDRFAIARHVRHARLPPPGDDEALRQTVARLLARPLDPARPLWELWFLDGLEGRRVALLSKMHHCMVDGVAGAGLLPVLLSSTPLASFERGADWQPQAPPGRVRLFVDGVAERVQLASTIAAEAWQLATEPGQARQWLDALRGIFRTIELGLQRAPESPINRPIEPHRRVSWLVSDFEQVRAIRASLGGTVNDVVLAVVAGALRRFLRERDPEIAIEDHHALVPVSVRSDGDGSLGNRVAGWIVSLPASVSDSVDRHSRIREATAELRASHVARGGDLLTGLSSLLLTVGLPLLERVQPFNLVVSNIPGPQVPLYLLGSRLVGVHPHVPLFPNQALSVAVMSYAGRLGWGFVGDCHAMPDLDRFASAVAASLEELAENAGVARRAAVAPAPRPVARQNGHDGSRPGDAARSPSPPPWS